MFSHKDAYLLLCGVLSSGPGGLQRLTLPLLQLKMLMERSLCRVANKCDKARKEASRGMSEEKVQTEILRELC